MKRVITILACCILMVGNVTLIASASTLDDLVNQAEENQSQSDEQVPEQGQQEQEQGQVDSDGGSSDGSGFGDKFDNAADAFMEGFGSGEVDQERIENNKKFVESLNDVSDLSTEQKGMTPIKNIIKMGFSYAIQFLAYLATGALSLRVVLDVIYIKIPFLRGFLYKGPEPQAQQGMGGGGFGQSGFGQSGFGQSGFGQSGFGGGGFGGGGFGGGGFNNTGFGGNSGGFGGGGFGQNNAPQQQGILRKIQLISKAALAASAVEGQVDQDGTRMEPLKIYAKDMVVTLVITPIFLVLAISGAFVSLGLAFGEAIVRGISALT